MHPPSETDPTRRFSGLATAYARFRPTYPESAVRFVLDRCGLTPSSVLVDVGCGTGISSRGFAAHGLHVIGIEPNEEMRAEAESEPAPRGAPRPEYRKGRAEATGLPDASADAVLAAQAFHWFEPSATLPEFHRILRPGGWVVLLWNTRDERDPFTAEYGRILWSLTDRARTPEIREDSPAALEVSPLFAARETADFPNDQRLDEEGLVGRAFSASYAPKEAERREAYAAALHALFQTHARDGAVVLRYTTEVHLAQRR
jgi:SAM-dependent methyltransferase